MGLMVNSSECRRHLANGIVIAKAFANWTETLPSSKSRDTKTRDRYQQKSWLLPTERASAVKTRMNGLSWQYVQPFWYNTSVWQTDGRTDRIWIAKTWTCFELLRGWCTWKWMFIFRFSVFIWLEMRINGRYTDRGRECVYRSRPSH